MTGQTSTSLLTVPCPWFSWNTQFTLLPLSGLPICYSGPKSNISFKLLFALSVYPSLFKFLSTVLLSNESTMGCGATRVECVRQKQNTEKDGGILAILFSTVLYKFAGICCKTIPSLVRHSFTPLHSRPS